jgi:hypothetical protein
VPTSWNIDLREYNPKNGKLCADLIIVQTMSGSSDKCIEGLKFGRASYNFRGKRRGVDDAEAKAQGCTSSQKANV